MNNRPGEQVPNTFCWLTMRLLLRSFVQINLVEDSASLSKVTTRMLFRKENAESY